MRFVKQFHEIKLKDLIELDATKKANSLLRFPVPLFFCRSKVEALCKEIFESFGNKEFRSIADDFDELLSYRDLQLYEILFKIVQIEILLKLRIVAWQAVIGTDVSISIQTQEIIDTVKRYTGIEIKSIDDVATLRDWIQFKQDKYLEKYSEPERAETETKSNFIRVIYSVFNFLHEPLNEQTRLTTIIEMKQFAEERIKTKTLNDGE